MGYRGFSVCLISVHLPDDAGILLPIGEESQRMIRSLHRFAQEKLVAAVNSYRTAELLDQSIFCCCIPEGMLMLRCTAEPLERRAALDGFLITKDTLRTAWHLSRWKLLFVCAAGWERQGTVWLSHQEIEQIAMSLEPPPALQAKLMDASRKMLESPAPFSFAVTNYPLHEIPVQFPGLVLEQPPADGNTRGEIPLRPEQAAALAEHYRNEISVLKTLRLYCGSKKQYQQLRLRNAAPFEDKALLQKQLRDELSQYTQEELWYFTVQVTQELWYVRALRASAQLAAGSIPFSELYMEMESFIDDTYRWIGQITQHEETPAPEEAQKGSAAEQKPGGFLRSLFRK